MAKSIKLPLVMGNNITVRTLDELQHNWDLEKIVEYYHNGRLASWLKDRYYDDLIEQVNVLDSVTDARELQKQLCQIFSMPFVEERAVDVHAIIERDRKCSNLRKITADENVLANVNIAAFNQSDLMNLLAKGEHTIYLVNNQFEIPLQRKNIKYIGIGKTTAVIKTKGNLVIDFEKLGIVFVNIQFDSRYMEITANPKNVFLSGNLYFQNGDFASAVKLYLLAAEQGYTEAQSVLGVLYDEGKVVAQNSVESVKWYLKAAENGDSDAQSIMFSKYYNGDGVIQSDVEAVKWATKAAEQGKVSAQAFLAGSYLQGIGVEKDDNEAAKWCLKAAEQGLADAQSMLGSLYDEGCGVRQDYTEAAKWYRKAAEQGDADAQTALGNLYLDGNGVRQDYTEAAKWYCKAADQGNSTAQYKLGWMYSSGKGTNQSLPVAFQWFSKSANQENPDAELMVGVMFGLGQGVQQNLEKADRWIKKAAEHGNMMAEELMESVPKGKSSSLYALPLLVGIIDTIFKVKGIKH